ncbi:MAG: hypothetical protein Q8P18_20995 [Pseudomonadota bacterium]|nr:hypothetical protein [Pseudomonadota bacterium]
MLGVAALGRRAGKKAKRVQKLGGREVALPPRCAGFSGYNLHAGVGLRAGDWERLEELCRYILRRELPPSSAPIARVRPRNTPIVETYDTALTLRASAKRITSIVPSTSGSNSCS